MSARPHQRSTVARSASTSPSTDGRTLGSMLMVALLLALARKPSSTGPPGCNDSASEPACTAATSSGRVAGSSSSAHCQSAVPTMSKRYEAPPSGASSTMARLLGSVASTARERSTPLASRLAAQPATEGVARKSCQQGGVHLEPGKRDGRVGRAAAGDSGPASAGGVVGHEVDERFAADHDHRDNLAAHSKSAYAAQWSEIAERRRRPLPAAARTRAGRGRAGPWDRSTGRWVSRTTRRQRVSRAARLPGRFRSPASTTGRGQSAELAAQGPQLTDVPAGDERQVGAGDGHP